MFSPLCSPQTFFSAVTFQLVQHGCLSPFHGEGVFFLPGTHETFLFPLLPVILIERKLEAYLPFSRAQLTFFSWPLYPSVFYLFFVTGSPLFFCTGTLFTPRGRFWPVHRRACRFPFTVDGPLPASNPLPPASYAFSTCTQVLACSLTRSRPISLAAVQADPLFLGRLLVICVD